MKKLVVLAFGLSAMLMTGCQSTANDGEIEAAKVDPRQGEKVSQVCFGRNIDGWRNIKGERDAVIMKKGIKEEYKVEFVGACDARNAMMNIATVSRGASSCLSRGDKIVIPNGLARADKCMVTGIYEWDESKKVENADENASQETKTTD